MLGKFKGWFSALSLIGKTGVILAVVSTGAIVNAVSQENTVTFPPEAPPTVQGQDIEHKTVTATESVPFETRTVDDPNLAAGTDRTQTEGVNGIKTKTHDVTYTNGKETNRVLVKEEVTTQPITKVIARGTKPAEPQSNCVPGYSPCITPGPDVDCAGGTGNGPRYVSGPIYVTGSDPYGLDADADGVGCE